MSKVSIVIPTFNACNYVIDLIGSLLNIENIEILIVDDGSTDLTVQTIKKKFKDNVALYTTDHVGPGNARNIGISNATSEYIMFIDSDDKLDISKFIDVLKNIPEGFDIVSYTRYKVDQNICNDTKRNQLCVDVLRNNYRCGFIPAPFTKLYKTKFIKENHLFFPKELKMGEDKLFNLTAILKSKRIAIRHRSFYLYRNNPTSLTRLYRANSISEDIALLKKIEEFTRKNKFNYDFRHIVVNYWITDGLQAAVSGADKTILEKYRAYVLSICDIKFIFSIRMPLKKKTILILLLCRCYSTLKLIKKSLTIIQSKEKKQVTYTRI